MQAREIVKANNLTDQVVVIHGRVEVRLPFYVYSQFSINADCILQYVMSCW